jgi:hypothetical protein
VTLYGAAVIGSAASLALGFWRDGSPPAIGLLERALALAAVTWVAVAMWEARGE